MLPTSMLVLGNIFHNHVWFGKDSRVAYLVIRNFISVLGYIQSMFHDMVVFSPFLFRSEREREGDSFWIWNQWIILDSQQWVVNNPWLFPWWTIKWVNILFSSYATKFSTWDTYKVSGMIHIFPTCYRTHIFVN